MRTALYCGAALLLSTIACGQIHTNSQECIQHDTVTEQQAKAWSVLGPLLDSATTCILSHSDIDIALKSSICALKSMYIHNVTRQAACQYREAESLHGVSTIVTKLAEFFYLSGAFHEMYYDAQELSALHEKVEHTSNYNNGEGCRSFQSCHLYQYFDQIQEEYKHKADEIRNNTPENVALSLSSICAAIFGCNFPA